MASAGSSKDDAPEFHVLLEEVAKAKGAQVTLANAVAKSYKSEQHCMQVSSELAKAVAVYAKNAPEELQKLLGTVSQYMQQMEKERETVIKSMGTKLLGPTQQYLKTSSAKIEERRAVYEKDKATYIKQVKEMTKKSEKAGKKVEKMQEAMKELIQTKKAYDDMVDTLRNEIGALTHTHDIAMMDGLSQILDAELNYHGQCYALLTQLQQTFRALPETAKSLYDPNKKFAEEDYDQENAEEYGDYTFGEAPPPPDDGDNYDYEGEAPPPPPPRE